jgi:hypothetical protein
VVKSAVASFRSILDFDLLFLHVFCPYILVRVSTCPAARWYESTTPPEFSPLFPSPYLLVTESPIQPSKIMIALSKKLI